MYTAGACEGSTLKLPQIFKVQMVSVIPIAQSRLDSINVLRRLHSQRKRHASDTFPAPWGFKQRLDRAPRTPHFLTDLTPSQKRLGRPLIVRFIGCYVLYVDEGPETVCQLLGILYNYLSPTRNILNRSHCPLEIITATDGNGLTTRRGSSFERTTKHRSSWTPSE